MPPNDAPTAPAARLRQSLGPRGRFGTRDSAGISSQTSTAAAVGAILVVLVAVPLSAVLNIWLDEAFTLHTTGSGPVFAWQQSAAFELQPPLYFVSEAVWRMLDEHSILFARLPSVAFAAGAVAVLIIAARRLAPRAPLAAVVALTAFNPFVVWAATEMRSYALLLVLGALLNWLFFEGVLRRGSSRTARIWYTLCAVAALYTQYYVGFLLLAHGLTVLAVRRNQLRSFALMMIAVAACFAPFVAVVLANVGASADFVSHPSPVHTLLSVCNGVATFLIAKGPVNGTARLVSQVGFVAVAAVVFIVGRPAVALSETRAFVVQWLLSIGSYTAAFLAGGVPMGPVRHLAAIASSTILCALIVVSSATRRRRFVGAFALAMFGAFAISEFVSDYRPPLAKGGDWQRAAAVLSAAAHGLPVVVFPAEYALPLDVYYAGPTLTIGPAMPFDGGYTTAMALHSEAQVAAALAPIRASRLWLVTHDRCTSVERPEVRAERNFGCRYLAQYLAQHYRLDRTVGLNRSVLRLYEPR